MIYIIFLLCIAKVLGKTLFQLCDIDGDNHLSAFEIKDCSVKHHKAPKPDDFTEDEWKAIQALNNVDSERFVAALDANNDNKISTKEYMDAIRRIADSLGTEENIEVTQVDGTKRTVTKQEIFDKMGKSPENVKVQGDMLVKDIEGTISLDDIALENPDLNRFILTAKWGLSVLTTNNFFAVETENTVVNAALQRLRSLPPGGSINRGKESMNNAALSSTDVYKSGAPYEVWFEMDVSSTINEKINNFVVEMHIVRDAKRYVAPHFKVLGAWELDDNGNRKRELILNLSSGQERRGYIALLVKLLNDGALYIKNSLMNLMI